MAGLFGFGSKNEEFFLDSDDAKTMGDIDYMRKSKKVKRTFPNTIGGKGAKIVQEVSSLGKTVTKNDQISQSVPAFQSGESASVASTQAETKQVVEKRRSSDHSMDMFRKMAKSINK
jgi:hypothetical protein